jgi:hypothetical protein
VDRKIGENSWSQVVCKDSTAGLAGSLKSGAELPCDDP